MIFKKPSSKIGSKFIAILFILVFFILSSKTYAIGEKSVLLISSYHPGFPTFFQQIEGVKSVFQNKRIQLDVEFMDSKRFNDEQNLTNFYQSIQYKLSQATTYDIIMAADDNALLFILEHKQNLFDGKPVIFFGVNSVRPALKHNANQFITGVIESVSMEETIDLITNLHKKTKKIIAIADGTTSGQGDLKTFFQFQSKFKSVQLSQISLQNLSFTELTERLKLLDDESVVLLLSAYIDKNGKSMLFHESLELINSNLSRPLYHLWQHGLGNGILGGKIISHFQQGKEAAKLVIRILEGEPPKSIPIVTASPNMFMFDYNELIRFNINESHLPKDSIIINLPDTFYSRNKSIIWIAVFLILVLSIIILILSVNIIRRMKAEDELKKYRDHLEYLVKERTIDLEKEITERKQAEEEKNRLILELQDALDQVKQLKGLIPICASCKKIRDDKGYWNQIEVVQIMWTPG